MKWQQFRGTGVALVTPFKNGNIDFEALGRVIEHVIAGKVEFLVSLGTTGESVTLSKEEKFEILDFTIKATAGRVPIVAGFGGNNTAKLKEQLQEYHFEGIAAILSSSPAYNKPSQEGIYRHYMELAEVAPRPTIIYNVPSRTASNIEPKTTIRLAKAAPDVFIGVKEACPDMMQIYMLNKYAPDDFLVLSGDDTLTLPLLASGGDGVISVIANALPLHFSDMVRAALGNDYNQRASDLHLEMLEVHPWLYVDGNPAGIKAALEILGLCSKEVRLPLVPIRDENYLRLKQELEKVSMELVAP